MLFLTILKWSQRTIIRRKKSEFHSNYQQRYKVLRTRNTVSHLIGIHVVMWGSLWIQCKCIEAFLIFLCLYFSFNTFHFRACNMISYELQRVSTHRTVVERKKNSKFQNNYQQRYKVLGTRNIVSHLLGIYTMMRDFFWIQCKSNKRLLNFSLALFVTDKLKYRGDNTLFTSFMWSHHVIVEGKMSQFQSIYHDL